MKNITKSNMPNVNIFVIIQKRLLFFTAAFFILAGCSEQEPEKLYNRSPEGISYIKYSVASDTAKVLQVGDIVKLEMEYYTSYDSLLFSTDDLPGDFRVKLEDQTSDRPVIEDALRLLSVGDSIEFYLDAISFFQVDKHIPLPDYLNAGDSLRFNLKVLQVETPEKLEAEKEKLHSRLQYQEDQLIDEYAKKHFDGVEPLSSGLYVKVFTRGKGTMLEPGDEVALDYTMSYLNGEVFYSTINKPEPFIFKMGKGMVIPGLEAGVAQLPRGSHALILIPSHLAYGAEGYKMIKPFTPLVFEVKVLVEE